MSGSDWPPSFEDVLAFGEEIGGRAIDPLHFGTFAGELAAHIADLFPEYDWAECEPDQGGPPPGTRALVVRLTRRLYNLRSANPALPIPWARGELARYLHLTP